MDGIEGGGMMRIKAYDIATFHGYMKNLKSHVSSMRLGSFMDGTKPYKKPEGPKVDIFVTHFNDDENIIIMLRTPRPQDVATNSLTTLFKQDKNANWDVLWIEVRSPSASTMHVGMLSTFLVQSGIKRKNIMVSSVLVHNDADVYNSYVQSTTSTTANPPLLGLRTGT